MQGCLACDLADGRIPLPGGVIHEGSHWLVEHCVGPLGVGTLLVKPKRHVTRVAKLTEEEAAELGPLLRRTAAAVDRLLKPEQVYTWLFSDAGGRPVHIHYVVQPATRSAMDEFGAYGPELLTAMFARGEQPASDDVARFAEKAREIFSFSAPRHQRRRRTRPSR